MSVTASDGQQVVSESFEEFISKFEFTQDFMKYWGQGAAKNVKFYKGLIEEMHNLIRVRNRILTLLKEIHESYYNRDIYKGYSKDDICTVGDI